MIIKIIPSEWEVTEIDGIPEMGVECDRYQWSVITMPSDRYFGQVEDCNFIVSPYRAKEGEQVGVLRLWRGDEYEMGMVYGVKVYIMEAGVTVDRKWVPHRDQMKIELRV